MIAGRPKRLDPGILYAFAHQLYWEFRGLDEGYARKQLSKSTHERLVHQVRTQKIELNEEQKSNLTRVLNEEIEDGRLDPSSRETRKREMEDGLLASTLNWRLGEAEKMAERKVRVPGEPSVIEALFQAKTPEEVSQICKDSPNWPISIHTVLPHYLTRCASEFIAAKNDPRFPRSKRPSSRLKQLWFLSRALAGAIHGYETRTAINLVGSIRPEEAFEKSRSAKPARRHLKTSRESRA
jgi:hypothetical protein